MMLVILIGLLILTVVAAVLYVLVKVVPACRSIYEKLRRKLFYNSFARYI